MTKEKIIDFVDDLIIAENLCGLTKADEDKLNTMLDELILTQQSAIANNFKRFRSISEEKRYEWLKKSKK